LTPLATLLMVQMAAAASRPAPVSTLLATGDCVAAIDRAGPADNEPTGIRIALAQCHLKGGDAATGLDLLQTPPGDPLAAYAQALEGGALLEVGQPIEAVQALQEALDDARLREPLRAQARLYLGRALLGIDDSEGATDALRGLLTSRLAAAGRLPEPGGVDPGEVRWWLAQCAVRLEDRATAKRVWQEIWTKNPTSPHVDAATDALAAAGSPVPDPTSREGRGLIGVRIRTLEKLFRFPEALALREQLPAGDPMTGQRRIANAVFKAKDYVRAAGLYAALSSPTPEDRIRLALARVRSGDYSGSNAVYRSMAQPGQPRAEFATWKLGYMAYDAGELVRAGTELQAYLDQYPSGEYADDALWYQAMAAIRLGENARAGPILDEIATSHGSSSLTPGARYWSARIADMAGNTADARAGYERVLTRWPVSGYAWFAAHRLGKSWPKIPAAQVPSPPPSLQTEAWTIGNALMEAGLHAWARPHLNSLKRAAKATGRDGALALAHALARAGNYVDAKALARPHCTKPWKGGAPVAMQACHPGPTHIPLVLPAGLPRSLPFAIMNAESGLRPDVTSPAGARGLMQLMPALATTLHAARHGVDPPLDSDTLYMPIVNATLGTDELGNLSATFGPSGVDPSVVLVIAGYNGGAEAVQRWIDAWPTPPEADLFTENIGYTETRRYVRRVLGYLQAYRYVYGD
jgi:soluble lytic murein transglycosylase-like protein